MIGMYIWAALSILAGWCWISLLSSLAILIFMPNKHYKLVGVQKRHYVLFTLITVMLTFGLYSTYPW